ncbi:uncharacterized protein LOC135493574 isoform X2 [Lineus longissimus]
MGRYSRRRFFLATVAMTALFSFPLMLPKDAFVMEMSFLDASSTGLLVNTEGCKIPDIDPFDKSISHLIYKGNSIKCDAKPAITYVDKTWLRFNMTILKEHYGQGLDRCEYQTVTRGGDGKSDDLFLYEEPIIFTDDIRVLSEFIRIACFGENGDMIYTNFHAFIQDKSLMDDRANLQFDAFINREKPKETMNVLMVGLDSMSRLNFIRQMPKTREFLLNTLGAVEMAGYNKVADNTFVNLVPMFAGKFVEGLPWTEMMSDDPFDKYNFMWKEFSRRGYRTLMAEDAPKIAIFNFNKAGFHKQPTDYYMRPLSLAMENHRSIWRNDHNCVGPKLETEIVLDWVNGFVDRFKNKPHFAFSFITRLTHDDVNKAGAADEPHFQFLTTLHEKALLNNTIVIYFSDHGVRFGSLREGYIGKIEERLPAMFLAFPKWFRKKYPALLKNIRTNGNRLTTPFDIYETLGDIRNFQPDEILSRKTSGLKRGISLFEEVLPSRSCDTASILTHWCTCHSEKDIDTNYPNVVKAADFLLRHMNSELDIHNLGGMCEILSVHKVENAQEIVANDKVLHFKRSLGDVLGRTVTFGNRTSTFVDYQLAVRTVPGDGLFETTVRFSEIDQTFAIVGDISRINRYGDQSSCINNFNMKKYCYCRQ